MKINVIFIIVCLLASTTNVYSQYFETDTARLNRAYRELTQHPQNATAQKEFFEAFPCTWEKLYSTYRYSEDKEYDLTMFYHSVEHLRALRHLESIADSVYCNKMVSLSIGGRADANMGMGAIAGYGLKAVLQWMMQRKSDAVFAVLARFKTGHQFEFWEFYWSNTIYRKEAENEFEKLKQKYAGNYPEEVGIMCDAFKYFNGGVNYAGNGFEDTNEQYMDSNLPKSDEEWEQLYKERFGDDWKKIE